MLLKNTLAVGIVAAVISFSANANSGKDINAGEASTDSPTSAVEKLAMASQLIDYGVENQDPLVLLVAARMQAAIPTKEDKQSKQVTGNGLSESATKKSSDPQLSPLELARELATEQQLQPVLALIDAQEEVRARGLVGGPAIHSDRVKARRNDIYTLNFKGGEQAAVFVSGDGDTDLDLYVYDENGNQICKDTDGSDTMLCRWTPRWTGEFEIKIKNLGTVYNDYTMIFE
ncbi:hypothetical protein QKW35_19575 [Pontibacterium granulatum]|uniref:hypothetical protein n=1 Tax=Pontibacterium granulatum TaxID=2036029 RepID=UPI00249A3226|nr:hypothetical protein [Pontibacterium granulatum]MDI3326584.1 hypothetical protein [Pontibacterium granulatum]